MDNKGLVIIGAGGHAKVVASTALASGVPVRGFLDDNPALVNKKIGHYAVLGEIAQLGFKNFTAVVFGLGNNHLRKNLALQYQQSSQWPVLIHPHAYVHPSAKLGQGTVVFAGAIIQPDVEIGEHCIINTGATVDHDCRIGSYSHLAPGVHLAGTVTLGEGVFLGIGSVVIPEIQIGDWVQVAAGAAVVNSIPALKKVMGVPAKEKVPC